MPFFPSEHLSEFYSLQVAGIKRVARPVFPIREAPNSRCDALPFKFPKPPVLHHKVLTRPPSLVITYDAQ